MRPYFADHELIREETKRKVDDGEAFLRAWWHEKHAAHISLPFGERTTGDLIEEFYLDRALELRAARIAIRDPNADAEALSRRIDQLEALFVGEESEEEEDFSSWLERQENDWKDVSLG